MGGIRIGFAVGLTVGLVMVFAISRRGRSHLITLLNTTSVAQGPRYRVWRVDSMGRVKPLPYDENVLGQTMPVPSPDGRWIAFVDPAVDFDIHLLDVQTLRERRITRFGRPPTTGYTWVEVVPEDWSPHSRRLLLQVASGGTDSEDGDLKVPKAPYGFYIYDLSTGTTQPVTLPKEFQFVGWLRDGRFVGVLPGRLPREDRVVIVRAGETKETEVEAINGSSYQTSVSADGKWLVGLHADNGGPPGEGTAQILKVNLSTIEATPLVTLSSWSANERPALSPDDKHVAYKREKREHAIYHTPQESLFVDDRALYSCSGTADFRWVDNRMIALACQDEVLVLDANSGKTLSKYKLPPLQVRH